MLTWGEFERKPLWQHGLKVFWGVYVQCLIIICVVVVAPDHSNLLLAVHAVL
jgi:hypothetical protein